MGFALRRGILSIVVVLIFVIPPASGASISATPPQHLGSTYDAASETIHLTWDAPAYNSSEVTGYRIYENGQLEDTVADTSAVVDPLSTRSIFHVTAVVDGTEESLPSNPTTVSTEETLRNWQPCVDIILGEVPPVSINPDCLDEWTILIWEKVP